MLTGASFEKDINEEFLKDYPLPAYDHAGSTDILELPGLIKSCSLIILYTLLRLYHLKICQDCMDGAISSLAEVRTFVLVM